MLAMVGAQAAIVRTSFVDAGERCLRIAGDFGSHPRLKRRTSAPDHAGEFTVFWAGFAKIDVFAARHALGRDAGQALRAEAFSP